jgi:8-oxo-dGTP pyrophosphatase MutT (NUDIX family)
VLFVSSSGKRVRGTALVFRDNTVLLVRDRGQTALSLPGGKHEKGEALLCTAARELHEELSLRVWKAERIYRCDRTSDIRRFAHVDAFLRLFDHSP